MRRRLKKRSLFFFLYIEGKELAVTCRWDDNWYVDNVKIGAMTEEVGIKGTFFLNGYQTKGKIVLDPWTDDYKYHCASPFFALQVDAFSEGVERKAIRFYLTTNGAEAPYSVNYPKGNFDVLGPIPDVEWSGYLIKPFLTKKAKKLTLKDGSELVFSAEEPNPHLMEEAPDYDKIRDGHARFWAAEMVLTTGTMMWLGEPLYGYYIIQSQVDAKEAAEIFLLADNSLQQVFLNGSPILKQESKEGWSWQPAKANRYPCLFKAGKNDLLIVLKTDKSCSFQSKQGTMLRFTQDKKLQMPYLELGFSAPSRGE